MAIVACTRCGAKNRVDERANTLRPVCGKCGADLPTAGAGGKPLTVTDATFARDVLAAGARPVLLDCWAPWCGPCRAIAPVVDQLAAASNGSYVIAKLNVDENPQTARQFGIQSIPTLLIFKGGMVVDQLVGVQPPHVIQSRLASHVG